MNRFKRVLRKFSALTHRDRGRLIQGFIWLTIADVILRVPKLRQFIWARYILPPVVTTIVDEKDMRRAREYASWVDIGADHHAIPAFCLHRSLALQLWLRREALPSSLKIGVYKEVGALKGHAWVELAGEVINDTPEAITPYGVMKSYVSNVEVSPPEASNSASLPL